MYKDCLFQPILGLIRPTIVLGSRRAIHGILCLAWQGMPFDQISFPNCFGALSAVASAPNRIENGELRPSSGLKLKSKIAQDAKRSADPRGSQIRVRRLDHTENSVGT